MTDPQALERVTDMFRALANPLRVEIVRELHGGDRTVNDLVAALGASQPLVSQHLAVLRGVRLVARRRDGRHVSYRLVDHHVAHIVEDAVLHAEEDHGD